MSYLGQRVIDTVVGMDKISSSVKMSMRGGVHWIYKRLLNGGCQGDHKGYKRWLDRRMIKQFVGPRGAQSTNGAREVVREKMCVSESHTLGEICKKDR